MEHLVKTIIELFSGANKELIVFIISILPILELRGGLLAASLLKVNFLSGYIVSIIGNILPIPLVLLFLEKIFNFLKKSKYLEKIVTKFENKVLSRLTNNANSICYVVDYGTKGFVFGSGGNVYRGDGRNASGPTECRWIDYVGRVTKANDKTKDNRGNLDKSVNYYRLSFK